MPNFIWSQALTANQQGFDPLTTWQFRQVPYPAVVTVFARSTTAGVRLTISSGSQTIKQRSPVQGGGTAGTTPTVFTTTPVTFVAQPLDLITLVHDEVLGGTPTVDGEIMIDPI